MFRRRWGGFRLLGALLARGSGAAAGPPAVPLQAVELLTAQGWGGPAWRAGPPRAGLGISISNGHGFATQAGGLREFRLAQTGEGIKECELVRWFVAEGDRVEEFQRVCEVQSDKATLEITSPYAGVVAALRHRAGDVVPVGAVLADIMSPEDLPPKAEASPAVRRAAGELGVSLDAVRGTGPGGRVTKADVEEAAAAACAAAEAAPLTKVSHPSNEHTPAFRATQAADMEEEAAAAACAAAGAPSAAGAQPSTERPPAFRATQAADVEEEAAAARAEAARSTTMPHPATQRTPAFRATQAADVEEAAAARAAAAAPLTKVHHPATECTPAPQPEELTTAHEQQQQLVVPLRGYRRAMFKSMTAAASIPHFHFCEEVRVDAVIEAREALRHAPALRGAKLTYLPFFLKAAAAALGEHPALNASLAPGGEDAIIQHAQVHLGVAIATPWGLAVPVVHDVGAKSVAEVAQELARLQAAAGANQLRPEDLAGATFTVSNIGSVGGTYATPLVSPPQVAIMALGRVQRLPRYAPDGATLLPAHVMGVSLGADHRVVDGAAVAGFAQTWKALVETPGLMMLALR